MTLRWVSIVILNFVKQPLSSAHTERFHKIAVCVSHGVKMLVVLISTLVNLHLNQSIQSYVASFLHYIFICDSLSMITSPVY